MQAAREARRSWCIADNYRSQLIRPGQRVLFWVTSHPRRGVWGAGHVTGDVTFEGGRLHVPVRIPLLAEPLTVGELLSVGELRAMEVFRSPQQANPSWVRREELELLERLLPPAVAEPTGRLSHRRHGAAVDDEVGADYR
jgi:hypothetical protein